MLLWVFVTGHLIRRSKWMRLSMGSLKQPQSHRPWFLEGTLTTLTSTGEATQRSTNSPGSSWKMESRDYNFLSQEGGQSHKEWCAVWPHTNKQGRPCCRCEHMSIQSILFLALKKYKHKFPQRIWGWKRFPINLHLTDTLYLTQRPNSTAFLNK